MAEADVASASSTTSAWDRRSVPDGIGRVATSSSCFSSSSSCSRKITTSTTRRKLNVGPTSSSRRTRKTISICPSSSSRARRTTRGYSASTKLFLGSVVVPTVLVSGLVYHDPRMHTDEDSREHVLQELRNSILASLEFASSRKGAGGMVDIVRNQHKLAQSSNIPVGKNNTFWSPYTLSFDKNGAAADFSAMKNSSSSNNGTFLNSSEEEDLMLDALDQEDHSEAFFSTSASSGATSASSSGATASSSATTARDLLGISAVNVVEIQEKLMRHWRNTSMRSWDLLRNETLNISELPLDARMAHNASNHTHDPATDYCEFFFGTHPGQRVKVEGPDVWPCKIVSGHWGTTAKVARKSVYLNALRAGYEGRGRQFAYDGDPARRVYPPQNLTHALLVRNRSDEDDVSTKTFTTTVVDVLTLSDDQAVKAFLAGGNAEAGRHLDFMQAAAEHVPASWDLGNRAQRSYFFHNILYQCKGPMGRFEGRKPFVFKEDREWGIGIKFQEGETDISDIRKRYLCDWEDECQGVSIMDTKCDNSNVWSARRNAVVMQRLAKFPAFYYDRRRYQSFMPFHQALSTTLPDGNGETYEIDLPYEIVQVRMPIIEICNLSTNRRQGFQMPYMTLRYRPKSAYLPENCKTTYQHCRDLTRSCYCLTRPHAHGLHSATLPYCTESLNGNGGYSEDGFLRMEDKVPCIGPIELLAASWEKQSRVMLRTLFDSYWNHMESSKGESFCDKPLSTIFVVDWMVDHRYQLKHLLDITFGFIYRTKPVYTFYGAMIPFVMGYYRDQWGIELEAAGAAALLMNEEGDAVDMLKKKGLMSAWAERNGPVMKPDGEEDADRLREEEVETHLRIPPEWKWEKQVSPHFEQIY